MSTKPKGNYMNISDVLKKSTSETKAPARFPAGHYEVVITGHELLPFYWAKTGTRGLAYVPTVKPIRCLTAEDENDPELAEEQRQKLEDYGDWTGKEFTFAYTNRKVEPNRKEATVAEINFPLIETDESGESIGLLERHAWRFHMIENNVESGFVHDVLGMSYPEGEELGIIMDETHGKTFIAEFDYEARMNNPDKTDLRIVSVAQSS